MRTFGSVLGLFAMMLMLTIGCSNVPIPPLLGSAPTLPPTSIAATPFPTKVAVPAVTLIPTPSDENEARQVIQDFFQAVSAGDVESALGYWDLFQPDQPRDYSANIRKIVTGWATGKHQFTIGTITYSGLVAPGDYQTLPENDSRVSDAAANIRIDGADYVFSLTRGKGGWWIEGFTTASAAKPTATP
jgi:hypothetical protein